MAVIYARQSLDRDGEGVAVARQLEECRRLAKATHLTVDREYVDNDRSATKGARPAFSDLLAAVRAGTVDTIICWHTDRLYRRVRDLVELVELAEKHALKIVTVMAGDLDLSTPAGRMIAGMLGHAAAYEVQHKGARQRTANLERARRGIRHFGSRPYGYERVDGKIQVVEAEAAVLREAIDRYVAGESWYAIANDFRDRGIRALNGHPFTHQNLQQRATKPALAGVRTYLGDVVNEEGDWPPLIDRATWERLQTAVATRTSRATWDRRTKYLGSGIYECGVCGQKLRGMLDYNHGRDDRFPVYECPARHVRRRQRPVDELAEALLLERLSQPDILRILSPAEDVTALAREARDIRTRIEGLAALYADGVLSASAVRTEKERLQGALDRAQQRIASASGSDVLNGLLGAEDVIGHWNSTMSILDRRRVLDALLKVTINPTTRGGRNAFRPEDVTIELRS